MALLEKLRAADESEKLETALSSSVHHTTILRKKVDSIRCGFNATPMPILTKTLLIVSETPSTYRIEMKAEFVSCG